MNNKFIVIIALLVTCIMTGIFACERKVAVQSDVTAETTLENATDQTSSVPYVDTQKYLGSGSQSTISSANKEIIEQELGDLTPSRDALVAIYKWKRNNFTADHAKGKYLGTQTVDNLIETRKLTGCNDHALLAASVARHFGIPTVLVNAAGIQWAKDYKGDPNTPFIGHAFLEFYVNGRWILIDSVTGEYIVDYDPHNPVIPLPRNVEPIGYYVFLKGLDLADSDVHSRQELNSRMEAVVPEAKAAADDVPNYQRMGRIPSE